MSGLPETPVGDTRGGLPEAHTAAMRQGIRGMLRLARVEADPDVRARLAYLAVAVGGFGDPAAAGQGADGPDRWQAELAPYRELEWAILDSAFVQHLMEAVPEPISSPGWTVTAREAGGVFVTRDGIRARAPAESVEPEDAPGDATVRVRVPAVGVGTAPGFVVRKAPSPVVRPWSRIYLNVHSEEAHWCLGPMAQALAQHLPVLLKVAAHPRSYIRRDACVIYLASDDLARGLDLVLEALEREGIQLRPGTPFLTREVSPGVGIADEPSDLGVDAPSHGRWAAHLLLAGLQTNGPSGPPSPAGEATLLRALVQGIHDTGRDPAHPHLRPGRTPLGPPNTPSVPTDRS